MKDEYFTLYTHHSVGALRIDGPFSTFGEANKLRRGSEDIVLKRVVHGTNEYGAPEEYQGVSYPAPIDEYADGEDG